MKAAATLMLGEFNGSERSLVPQRDPKNGEAAENSGRDISCDSGATIVEFAVSASVILLFLFGIIQCALALYSYNYVGDAARVGTRYASVRGASCTGLTNCGATSAQIQTYLRSIRYPGINANNLTVTTTWLSASSSEPTTWTVCASQCNAPENAVRVQVSYAYSLNIPFWKNANINIGSTSQVVISN
jgi:Flp pilus assembly protein TadG